VDNKPENHVIVRFAPSPTGFLHVGGARTAIFNWLFAKNSGGKFLLRIEDTDPERSKSELSAQILRSMKWLGMESDEPVVYQSDNIQRYKEIIFRLLKEGKAYYAFETPEELKEKRKTGNMYIYDRAALKLDKDVIQRYINENKPFVIRFLVPEGITEFNDLVHGKTTFNNSEIDDFVLLRSDGSPVYQIAVVVDDHDMNITHVIRGDDHLSNTPKQIMLYRALGWEIPEFAHLPMILDRQKKKLSKRSNTVSVEEYMEQGYLADALFNFLTLLGFAPTTSPPAPLLKGEGSISLKFQNNKQEIFSRKELIKLFSFERVNKKSSVFDTDKLNWMNFEYIQSAGEDKIINLLKEFLERNNASIQEDEYLRKVFILMRPRINTINEICQKGKYFFEDPKTYDSGGIKKLWTDENKNIFSSYFESLKNENWSPGNLEKHLRNFAESNNFKAGTIIHILRLALTGSNTSPGIFELMNVLGKEKVLSRIERFIKYNI